MTHVDLHTIEICAGVGMLGEGLRAGLAHLGCTHRTIAYIEREAYAASVLVARMEEGSLDAAPVWPDLLTFDGRRFRGLVDLIVAGFPCQDLSLAGKRAGLDGSRSGLFFDILDIADACGARGLVLENVAGIASATATVVDEAEGALEERAAARVLGELADRGWHAEWITLSASDVGASHGRARWFCWAWRDVGHADQQRQQQPNDSDGTQPRRHARACAGGSGCELANADRARPQGGGDSCDTTRRQITHGHAGLAGGSIFCPGPTDPSWYEIIAAEPWIAPALNSDGQHHAQAAYQAAKPLLRRAPDGLAHGLDFSHRAQRLKCVGNGVVALQAAAAFVILARRAGFMTNQPLAPVKRAQQATEFIAELETP